MDNIPAISAQKKSKLADGLGRRSTYCLEYLYTFWSKDAVEVTGISTVLNISQFSFQTVKNRIALT
jgi:hypothetical protein